MAHAQVVTIPDESKTDFAKRYPNAKTTKWSNKVSNYHCEFVEDEVLCTAVYSIEGDWKYTEKLINKKSVPGEVKESLGKSSYRNWSVKSLVWIENADQQQLYRYEVKKGIQKKYIFFDAKGVLIKENTSI
jgi:hypothetical protein